MDVETEYFHGILKELEDAIHPEVFHFRNGNHPGSEWYLKTVCPMPKLRQIDKIGYGILWSNIANEHPDEVKLVAHAYDWRGDEIPYMTSVWLDVESDVIIKMEPLTGLNIVLVDRDVGKQFYIESLRTLINFTREESKWNEDISLDEIDEIEKIANVLEHQTKAEDAIQIRSNFKVLKGDKKKKNDNDPGSPS